MLLCGVFFAFAAFIPLASAPAQTNGSLRDALASRKTVRDFIKREMPQKHFDDLVWAAYGPTHKNGDRVMRTAPSAMATYPIELYFAVDSVAGVVSGLYRYDTSKESPVLVREGKFLQEIQDLGYGQEFVSRSNVVTIMVYDPSRITRSGENASKYAMMECGHIGQNILLMATSLGYGSVPKASFDPKKVGEFLGIDPGKEPVYMICVGGIAETTG